MEPLSTHLVCDLVLVCVVLKCADPTPLPHATAPARLHLPEGNPKSTGESLSHRTGQPAGQPLWLEVDPHQAAFHLGMTLRVIPCP